MNSTEPDPSRSSPSLSLSCVLEKTNPAVERRRSCEKDDARTFAEDLQGAGAGGAATRKSIACVGRVHGVCLDSKKESLLSLLLLHRWM